MTFGEVTCMIFGGLSPKFTQWMGSKRKAFTVAALICVIFSVLFFFIPMDPAYIWVMVAVVILTSVGVGLYSPLLWSMYADVADYATEKNGTSSTGLIFSSGTMAQKFGTAISGSLVALFLGIAGFISGTDAATGQTIITITDEESVRNMIWSLFSIFPAAIALIMIFLINQHEKFQTWMERVGTFLKSLKTEEGVAVPIIFRPWHENNGSWFWWGQNLCSDEEFHGLWNMLQDYLNGEGLSNLLWSYSPNLDGNWDTERFLKRYPGDDRVSLIGEDAYQWGTEEDFVKQLTTDLDFLSAFAKEHGKMIALTECGYKNIPDSTWWTRVLKPIMDKYPISYFLLWRNYKEEYFGPAPSLDCADDYRKLYEADNTLFLNDINK